MAIAVEATGGYERDVVRAFQSRYTVCVLNPCRVRRFADAITPAKNDRIDARIIAHFAATISGEPAPPDDPVRSCVDELVKLRQLLCTHRVALQNSRRLAQAPEVRALLDQQIQAFATAIKQAERDIETTIRRSPKLLQTRNLVMSMPGIGPVVAAALVSQLPELGQVSTAKLAAIVGVRLNAMVHTNRPWNAEHARATPRPFLGSTAQHHSFVPTKHTHASARRGCP